MAEASRPRAYRNVFRVTRASVQDIKACAREAGFTGKTPQSPLLIYMAFKSRLQGFGLKLVGKALLQKRAMKAVGF